MNQQGSANSQWWITIVLITAVIMLVFLVFFGNKSSPPTYHPQGQPEIPKEQMKEAKQE